MQKQSVADRVREIVVDQLGVEVERVTNAARLHEDLGSDSLDDVELVMLVEEHFGLEIPDEDAEKHCTGTVGEFVAYVEKRVAAQASGAQA